MKKFKQILFITLWSLVVIGLLVSLGFVNKEQDSLLCKSLDININQEDELYFIDNLEIAQLLKNRGDSIVDQPKSTINVNEIETVLNNHPAVANAEVFVTIDGAVKVKIKQRKPVIRVFNLSDESYYLDTEGTLMPLSDNYTVKVLIANGNINESFARNYKKEITDTAFSKKSILDELYAMANYINNDAFWKAQIQQIYVNEERDMEIVPLVGDQRIIFGDTTALDEKFKKLKIFYKDGLNTTGWWNKYSTINLKYKNQIVCTKKE